MIRRALAGVILLAACGRTARDADHVRAADMVSSPDGNPIVFETHGRGSPALVFVHGWSADRSYWSEQIEPFARTYQVVTVDLAGHGESGMGREAWTIPAFGADVAAVVEELKLERVILIGHSMGGDVAVEAAKLLPGRVAGVIWVDAHKELGKPRSPEEVQAMVRPMRENLVAFMHGFVPAVFAPGADTVLVKRITEDMAHSPRRVAIPAATAALGFERELLATLRALKLPLVAINPDNLPTDTAALARYGVEVVIMPRAGHFLMLEDAERFNGLLRGVVEKLAAGL